MPRENILSHSRIFEDAAKQKKELKKAASKRKETREKKLLLSKIRQFLQL